MNVIRWSLFSLGAISLACGVAANVNPLSPEAEAVVVRKADPPPGATEVGPLEAEHGSGCGGFGRKGTYEGAMNTLREQAASAGATYVALISITEPHSEHGCFDQRFILRGMGYKLGDPPQETAKLEPGDASQVEAETCDPPCSPGYECSTGICEAVCNPPCSDGDVCRSDRTCGPAAATE